MANNRNVLLNNFGKYITDLRLLNNYSQKKLASELDVSINTIYNWEHDKSIPEYSLLPSLAGILNISVFDLLKNMIKPEKEQDNSFLISLMGISKENLSKYKMNELEFDFFTDIFWLEDTRNQETILKILIKKYSPSILYTLFDKFISLEFININPYVRAKKLKGSFSNVRHNRIMNAFEEYKKTHTLTSPTSKEVGFFDTK